MNQPLIAQNVWAWATARTINQVRASYTPTPLQRIYRFAAFVRQFRAWVSENRPGLRASAGWLATQQQQALHSRRILHPAPAALPH